MALGDQKLSLYQTLFRVKIFPPKKTVYVLTWRQGKRRVFFLNVCAVSMLSTWHSTIFCKGRCSLNIIAFNIPIQSFHMCTHINSYYPFMQKNRNITEGTLYLADTINTHLGDSFGWDLVGPLIDGAILKMALYIYCTVVCYWIQSRRITLLFHAADSAWQHFLFSVFQNKGRKFFTVFKKYWRTSGLGLSLNKQRVGLKKDCHCVSWPDPG